MPDRMTIFKGEIFVINIKHIIKFGSKFSNRTVENYKLETLSYLCKGTISDTISVI